MEINKDRWSGESGEVNVEKGAWDEKVVVCSFKLEAKW